MNTFLISFFSTLIPLLVIDFVWLSMMMKSFYAKQIGHLTSSSPVIIAAVIFYILYTIGLVFFVVQPAFQSNLVFLKVFLYGALFGLVAYGTYDLTNQATLKDWPVLVTIIDLAWGSLMTGAVSVIAVFFTKTFS